MLNYLLTSVIDSNIKIKFITNLDPKYSHWTFPKIVCTIPQVGDYVETSERRLKVCSITHKTDFDHLYPYLEIELTGPITH